MLLLVERGITRPDTQVSRLLNQGVGVERRREPYSTEPLIPKQEVKVCKT